MKKVLSTILATVIILSTFTACGTEVDEVENTTITKYTTKDKTNELVSDETATGTLVVSDYFLDLLMSYYDIASEMYNELYPNVELILDITTYDEMEWDDYYTKLSTEVMSGGGPDVFKLGGNQDAYKMMKSGVFADLTPYFENDQAFDVSEYNENVLYGAQFQGKQYIVPVGYTIQTFTSTKEIIDETGFDVDKCTNYYNTMEEVYRVSKENVLDAKLPVAPALSFLQSFYYEGLNVLDYSNNTVDLNNDIIRDNVEIVKDLYDLIDLDIEKSQSFDVFELFSKDRLFEYNTGTCVNAISYFGGELDEKNEGVLIPVRNATGEITAQNKIPIGVNANCDNVQNAYNFIKLLCHPDFLERAYHTKVPYVGHIPLSYEACQIYFDRHSEEYIDAVTGGVYGATTDGGENLVKLQKDFFDILREINQLDTHLATETMLVYDIIYPYCQDEINLDEELQKLQDKLELYISE